MYTFEKLGKFQKNVSAVAILQHIGTLLGNSF